MSAEKTIPQAVIHIVDQIKHRIPNFSAELQTFPNDVIWKLTIIMEKSTVFIYWNDANYLIGKDSKTVYKKPVGKSFDKTENLIDAVIACEQKDPHQSYKTILKKHKRIERAKEKIEDLKEYMRWERQRIDAYLRKKLTKFGRRKAAEWLDNYYWNNPQIAKKASNLFPKLFQEKYTPPKLRKTDAKCPQCGKAREFICDTWYYHNKLSNEICHECTIKKEELKQQQEEKSRIKMEEWRRKNKEILNHLKTMPYKEYLQTQHWQKLRLQALKKAWYRCQLCNGKKPLDVHHRTYERRGEEHISDLTVLCRECHEKYHDITPFDE
jgi:hypothetical protein